MFTEPFDALWLSRYGTPPPVPELPDLTPFLRHRSVREFAPDPVPEEVARVLFACAQSASTSSNLQLWSAISVQDPGRRARLAELCAGQAQVRESAWCWAFLADHRRLAAAARAAGIEPAGLGTMEFYTMAVIDAALAAERLACAAERLGLGVCYIGALRNDPAAVAALLDLPEGTFGLFGLCVGRPRPGCAAEAKPRLAQEAVWFRERYGNAPDTAEYDARLNAWNAARGRPAGWTERSGRRVDGSPGQMGGRAGQAAWLRERGMAVR